MMLAVATAGILAIVLLVALLAVLGFLFEIRRLVAGAADALEQVAPRAAQFAGHLSDLQRTTSAAADGLPRRRT